MKKIFATLLLLICLTGCGNGVKKINDVNLEMSYNGKTVSGKLENNKVLFPGEAIEKDGYLTLEELEDLGYSVSSKTVSNTLVISVLDGTEKVDSADWENAQRDFFAGTTRLNLNDSNNLLSSSEGNGEYALAFALEGTILVRDDFEYNFSKTPVYNVNFFKDFIHEVDSSIPIEKENLKYNGGRVLSVSYDEETGFIQIIAPVWGFRYPSLDFSLPALSLSRTLCLNSMVYFGGDNMAKAVYGMLDEHYRFRSDNDKPIDRVLAEKYGLKINSDKQTDDMSEHRMMDVTDGESSWIVEYWTANTSAYDSVTVYIPAT